MFGRTRSNTYPCASTCVQWSPVERESEGERESSLSLRVVRYMCSPRSASGPMLPATMSRGKRMISLRVKAVDTEILTPVRSEVRPDRRFQLSRGAHNARERELYSARDDKRPSALPPLVLIHLINSNRMAFPAKRNCSHALSNESTLTVERRVSFEVANARGYF